MTPTPSRDGGRPFWGWGDAALFLALLVPSLALALLLLKLITWIAPAPNTLSYLLGFQFAAYGVWLTALFLLMKTRYGRPFWTSLGWRVPWPAMSTTLLLGPLLALLVGLSANLLRTPDSASELQRLMQDRLSVILVGVFSTTLGPLCEELVFRGFFQPLLTARFGRWAGIILCAAPFALLHGPQYHWTWQVMVLLTAAGCVFGWVRQYKDSTAASTLVHATYNLTYFAAYLINKEGFF